MPHPTPDRSKITLREVWINNPLYVEFRRGWRRFLGVSGTNVLNVGVLALGIVIYLTIAGSVLGNLKYMDPLFVLYAYLGVAMFVIPAVGHGAVAGEREKRTWEVLLCGPLTNAEIIIGKYVTALMTSGIIFMLFFPLCVLCLFSEVAVFWTAALGCWICLSFTVFAHALTLLVSTLCKRAYAAQLATYGLFFVLYAVYPALSTVLVGNNENASRWLNCTHPFLLMSALKDHLYLVGVGSLIYLALSAAMLGFMAPNLRVGDGDSARRS